MKNTIVHPSMASTMLTTQNIGTSLGTLYRNAQISRAIGEQCRRSQITRRAFLGRWHQAFGRDILQRCMKALRINIGQMNAMESPYPRCKHPYRLLATVPDILSDEQRSSPSIDLDRANAW